MDHFWKTLGSGCGLVGRAVAYDTRIQSSANWRSTLLNLYRNEYNKEKEAGNGAYLLKNAAKLFSDKFVPGESAMVPYLTLWW